MQGKVNSITKNFIPIFEVKRNIANKGKPGKRVKRVKEKGRIRLGKVEKLTALGESVRKVKRNTSVEVHYIII
jgi:hypothetical protein